MANIQKNLASVVALGSQNPQILNEDFLKNNKIIPVGQTIFDKVTNFISTPPFATIAFGSVEIVVEEQRFQIREVGLSDWEESCIFDIAKEYYKVLVYTPITTVGINLNAQISFENSEEASSFQKLLMPETGSINEIIAKKNADVSTIIRYPYSDNGQAMLTVDKSTPDGLNRPLSFNYEFVCPAENQAKWSKFNGELEKIEELSDYFSSILKDLLKEI
jgi:hypothetical protein